MTRKQIKKQATRSSIDSSDSKPAKTASKREFLEELVGYNLRRAHGVQQQRFAAAFGADSIRPVLLSILGLIHDNRDLKQAELGKIIDIKRANIVTLLDELEERALVKRQRSKTDKRSHILVLTKKGDELTRKLLERHSRLEEDLAHKLGKTDRKQLIRLLKAFRKIGLPDNLEI